MSERAEWVEWVDCKKYMPAPGQLVLAFVPKFGEGAHSRRIRAQYAAEKTLAQHADADGGVYDDGTDTYYCEAGWYETNGYEEIHWAVTDPVTHWTHLPDAPSVRRAR